MGKSEITVIMPVYNCEEYLEQSIKCVLNQTYKDYVLLIINDGSTDSSKAIIESFDDQRIRYVENEHNLGLVRTLNKGIKISDTKYIARLDGDDLCSSDRLKIQYEYMENNPDVSLLGCSAHIIDKHNKIIGAMGSGLEDRAARTMLLFSNIFVHSSVMLRKESLIDDGLNYDINHIAVEDYGLWCKIAAKHKIVNLPQKLVSYRINNAGIMAETNKDLKKKFEHESDIFRENFERLHINASAQYIQNFMNFLHPIDRRADLKCVSEVYYSLSDVIRGDNRYDSAVFESVFSGICRGYFFYWNTKTIDFYRQRKTFFGGRKLFVDTLKYIAGKVKKLLS